MEPTRTIQELARDADDYLDRQRYELGLRIQREGYHVVPVAGRLLVSLTNRKVRRNELLALPEVGRHIEVLHTYRMGSTGKAARTLVIDFRPLREDTADTETLSDRLEEVHQTTLDTLLTLDEPNASQREKLRTAKEALLKMDEEIRTLFKTLNTNG